MRPIRGIILDVDGTLVDSNDAHVRAWMEAFEEQGRTVSEERVRSLIGMGGDNLLPAAVGVEKESEAGAQLSEARASRFKEHYLPELQPFAAVRQLLERMRESGLKLVVASSGEADEVETLLELAGVRDLVEATTSSKDAERSKPEPDVVEAALERLGYPPHEVVMLGDSPYDIEAADKVGIQVIALRCGGFADDDLLGALAIYDDPADLLAHYDDSPLAQVAVG
ncbi:MAG: HAD family hydrolase [Chloroflexota bacterium]|nr:HAD family hydrolase [Chloroflexota bacterium]